MVQGKLRSVRRVTLYEQIFDEIKRYITENDLQAGDRLPTEREMSETLNVSRHSVREALKSLEFMGVVTSQPKNGYTMLPFTMRLLTDQIMFRFPRDRAQLLQIVECRRILDLGVLDLVIERAKEWDFDRMERHLAASEDSLHDPQLFESHCLRFHDAIYMASGNELLHGQFEVVAEFFRRAASEIPIGPADGRVASLGARKDLFAALKARDRSRSAAASSAVADYYTREEVLVAMETTLLPRRGQAG